MEVHKKMKMMSSVQKLFGIDTFRGYQIKALESLLDGHDVFVAQPTGSGKSIIFQSLPFFLGEVVISNEGDDACVHGTSNSKFVSVKKSILIVCPLNSLIKDQIASLTKKGIRYRP